MGTEIEVTPLKRIYYRYLQQPISELDALGNNLTKSFFYELEWRIRKRYPIVIAILGRPGTGKSISGGSLMTIMTEFIIKHIDPKRKKPDYYKYMIGNQTEFIRFQMKDERDIVATIDEYSKMGEIGANASTERTIYEYYSDVFAQRFVNRIVISPETVLDRNADLILTFMERGNGFNKFKLGMREIGSGRMPLILGCVDVPIKDVIDAEWYKKYRAKKFRRMELLTTYRVKDPRELDIAGVVLRTVEILKDTAMVKKPSKDKVITAMEIASKEAEGLGIYSELTKPMICTHASTILGLIYEISREREFLDNMRAIPENKLAEVTGLAKKRDGVHKAWVTDNELLDKTLSYWHKMADLYAEYMEDR